MKELGCYPIPGYCKLENNAKTLLKEGKSYSCIEANSIQWRKAFLLGFIITLLLLLINKYKDVDNSLLYFVLCWFVFSAIIYFYFSFYAYHKSLAACKAGI